jgi:hypothetical protein
MRLAFIGKCRNDIPEATTGRNLGVFSLTLRVTMAYKHSQRGIRTSSPCLFQTHTINYKLLSSFLLGFFFDPEDGGSIFHRNSEELRRTAERYTSEGSALLRTSN